MTHDAPQTIFPALSDNVALFDRMLSKEICYDVIRCDLKIGDRSAAYYYIDGYINPQSMIKIHEIAITEPLDRVASYQTMTDFARGSVPYFEKDIENSVSLLIDAIYTGKCVLMIDGFTEASVFDVRSYPDRSIEEPEKNKTLRGPRDGFSETITKNTAMIRRRIKTTELVFEAFEIGDLTKTTVVLSYLRSKADRHIVDSIRKDLASMKIKALSMTQEVLAEKLFSKTTAKRLNPYPKVRYIERPDTACSMLLEGKILILCDTTPAAICVPVSIYDFFEETDDFYFPVLTGTYLKLVRIVIFLASTLAIPIWMLFIKYTEYLPSEWKFILIDEEYSVPIVLQFLIIEFALDGLKLASLNTPSQLSGSIGIVGGLLLGDFAVKSGWFVPQTILYSSFTAIANFIPTNFELGYCFKFQRILLILLSHFFGIYGFVAGNIFHIVILLLNKSVGNKSYLYPFLPFDKKAVFKIFFRGSQGREVQ